MTEKQKIFIYIIITLVILFSLRIALGVYLWKRADGMFILLRGDDMVRALQGFYAMDKFFLSFLFSTPSSPPFSALAPLVYGQGLRIYPDCFLIPSVINSIFGLGGVLVLFFLTRKLFGSDAFTKNMIGLLSVGMIIFYPAFVWATLSADRHSIFFFLLFVALLFWMSHLRSRKRIWLLLAAVAFLFSTPTMHEGWIYTFVFAIFMLKDVFITYKNSKTIDLFPVVCILIASLYILIRLFQDYHYYGHPLGYMLERTNYVGSIPDSLSARLMMHPCLLAKMFIFPILQLFRPSPKIALYPLEIEQLIFAIFVIAVVWWLYRAKRLGGLIFDYTLIVVTLLLVNIMLAIIGVDTVCVQAPRQFIANLFLFLPIASFVLYNIIAYSATKDHSVIARF